MWVFLNGEFVPEDRAVVSVFDRSFRYGDGLFETLLAVNGKIFRWSQHWNRLHSSARFFKLPIPCSADEILTAALELLRRNSLTNAVLRLQISRGSGPRGYAPTLEEIPVIVMTAHAAPQRTAQPWTLTVCPLRVVTTDRLQGHKTANRMLQVMAGMHARERGADEALILTTDGHVTEGSTSNVFWIHRGVVYTPPLTFNVLPGVTSAAVSEVCHEFEIPRQEQSIKPEELLSCEGVFLTFTSRGVVEVASLDGKPLQRSSITERLRAGFEALLARECA
jgi:aminodeoxychorismate lyase